jgi:BRCT domain type II-containing protein
MNTPSLFLATGVFPEVGGGTGLALGKDRTKAMIESFGGRVTSSVSGKTNFLVVGQEPGASKVSKAEERNLPLIDLLSLHRLLMGQQTIEAAASAPPPRITSFSAGYAGQKRISYY